MKITMYELLGLVKDGKAPKKVRYNDEIYDTETSNNFSLMIYETTGKMSDDGEVQLFLNEEVEIIEEEKKIPEKLIPTALRGIDNLDEKIDVAHIDTISAIETINEIIDYLKSKGE
jgi:hypothetical protein